MVKVVAIPSDDIDRVWHVIEPMYAKAIDKGSDEYDTDDLHSMIEDGELLPLVVLSGGEPVAALGVRLDTFPAKRVCTILIAGGTMLDEWMVEVNSVIKRLAQEQQADSIRIYGRRGWVRALRDIGYKEIHTTVELEL